MIILERASYILTFFIITFGLVFLLKQALNTQFRQTDVKNNLRGDHLSINPFRKDKVISFKGLLTLMSSNCVFSSSTFHVGEEN